MPQSRHIGLQNWGERLGQGDRNLGFIGGLIETLAGTQRTQLSVECNLYLHTAVKIFSKFYLYPQTFIFTPQSKYPQSTNHFRTEHSPSAEGASGMQ